MLLTRKTNPDLVEYKCELCDFECGNLKGLRGHKSRWCEVLLARRLAARRRRDAPSRSGTRSTSTPRSPEAKRSRIGGSTTSSSTSSTGAPPTSGSESDGEGASGTGGGDMASDCETPPPPASLFFRRVG